MDSKRKPGIHCCWDKLQKACRIRDMRPSLLSTWDKQPSSHRVLLKNLTPVPSKILFLVSIPPHVRFSSGTVLIIYYIFTTRISGRGNVLGPVCPSVCVSVCLRSSSLTVGPMDLFSVLFGSLLALQKWNWGINTVSGGEREVR